MAQGSKKSYTAKQKRKAAHIEEGEKKSGRSAKTAARIAWATVNKEDGGGKKSGTGRAKVAKKKTSKKSSKKGGSKKKKKASTKKRK